MVIKKLKLRYEIKTNLMKEDLSSSHKTKTKTKTEGNAKELFLLNSDESLFNRLEFIKNMKNNKS